MTDVVATVVGVVLVLAMLRDVVHELFDPEDTGSLSRGVMHGVWRLVRAVGRRHRSVVTRAGALVLLSVAGMWTVLLVLGFALVYWPHLPGGFHVSAGIPADASHGFVTALYVSLASMTTLNSSEITPTAGWLRFAVTFESLVGMGLVTAWITWVLSIYPVLARRRAFERQVDLVRRTQPHPALVVAEHPREALAELLRSLTEQVLRVASDFTQARVTYYFQNSEPALTLSRQLPYVLELARTAEGDGGGESAIRHHGALLRTALESLLADVGRQFLGLHDAPPEVVLEALARDHLLREPRPAAAPVKAPA